MTRCAHSLLAAVAICCSAAALAQSHRPFPPQALRGELVVQQTPDVLLNGKPARLAPGSRLRSDGHMLLPPASVAGQKLTVHYTLDPAGLLMDVWVLNPAELANKTWPRTPQETASWSFEPGTQTWTKR
ncbi:hypothetical protein HNP55_003857 [Paucibacter oligotrophus]|uniref:Uncharacterized protein n=1 Tax=Roseateles oligotrophus TaxID=1769250 RepID=A0A840LAV9_9BURK|nr:hypothetical protein [Roseateles oligotrophus]MBB4845310.1 hypothetical protein [Roseateles oligotrophus]